ncbi:MAG TPA: long-chain fatty acid--CoA ligase [Candidatus Acidoferrales bacterium]
MNSEYPAITKCFLDAVDTYANPRAQMYRTPPGLQQGPQAGTWEAVSAKEMLRRVAGLARALAELGVRPGDRVGLFAPNCPEWAIADFAIEGLGAVSVPVYFHESLDRLTYILKDSGARVVFTSGEEEARKIAECRAQLPALEHVISVAPPADLHGEILRYEALIATAGDADIAQYRGRSAEVSGKQLATIIYTSGTTGEPKGVMLSHANLTSNALDSTKDIETLRGDLALSFLPLSHVYERVVDYSYFFRGISVAYIEQTELVSQALLEVHPMMVAAVPRFFEKIYATIIEKGRRQSGWKRAVFDWAIQVATQAAPWRAYGRTVSPGVRLRWWIANLLVYSKFRQGMGGRIRTFTSGSAPLAVELLEFFWTVGLPIYQGYGLTETSPVVSASTPKAYKVGTVGRPIQGVEVKIAADGEILVKGSCVMQGYYNKPDQTREAFTPDGWLLTGDIGRIDQDGYLLITDRKKELLKTSGGKFVAPAPIENLLKTSPLIANAMVVGDGRKFTSVLVVVNFAGIEEQARMAGREFSTHTQMLTDPWVRDLYTRELERLTAPLAQYEKPKRFALIEQDFTYASGELTYTMKLKRRVIEQRYQDVIARLYADVEEPRPQRTT